MALKAENLGFYYEKKKWIFQNVNLELQRGEILGISGYSGCGKSTLAKLLAHYLMPKVGLVQVDEEPFRYGVYQPVQLVFQHPEKALNPKWRMRKSLYESFAPDRELLDRFGIQEQWMNRFPIEISGGEMQRFCIVRALSFQTKYLIADEMTTMLDAVTQAGIWREVVSVCKERNIGLMVVSHEKDLLSKLCHRILSMERLMAGLTE